MEISSSINDNKENLMEPSKIALIDLKCGKLVDILLRVWPGWKYYIILLFM
jgi:hypothetical protein